MIDIEAAQDAWPQRRTRWIWPVTRVIAAMFVIGLVDTACSGGGTSTRNEPAQSGSALYAENCASCHGADLRGTDNGPSHLSIVYEPNHHGDDAFRSAVQNGAQQHHWNFGDMLPIAGLADEEVDAIIAFVRDEQEREGFEQ